MRNKKTISLLLADDDPIIRAGIRALLTKATDIKIVGEAKNSFEAQQMVGKMRPKILWLDLKMPELSPAGLQKWVRENYPETITLVLTARNRDAYLVDMKEAGAAGYLPKGESAERLIGAIRRAANGEILFGSEQFARARRCRETVSEKLTSLTDHERLVLKSVADGMVNKAMAEALTIKPKTAAFLLAHILKTLGGWKSPKPGVE